MKDIIKVITSSNIHYIAQCSTCGWDCAIMTDGSGTASEVRSRTREHVRETGHIVTIKTGGSATYLLKKGEE